MKKFMSVLSAIVMVVMLCINVSAVKTEKAVVSRAKICTPNNSVSVVCNDKDELAGSIDLPSGTKTVEFHGFIASEYEITDVFYRRNDGYTHYENGEYGNGSYLVEASSAAKAEAAKIGENAHAADFKVTVELKEGTQKIDIYAGYGKAINERWIYYDNDREIIWSCTVTVGKKTEIKEVTVTTPEDFKYKDITIRIEDELTYIAVWEVYGYSFHDIRLNGELVTDAMGGFKGCDFYIPTPEEPSVITFFCLPGIELTFDFNKDGVENDKIFTCFEQQFDLPYISYGDDSVVAWVIANGGSGRIFSTENMHFYADDDTEFEENPFPVTLRAIWQSEVTKGDGNHDGSIDNKDVVSLFRYVSGSESYLLKEALDFNNDNEIDNKDVVTLFRYVSAH